MKNLNTLYRHVMEDITCAGIVPGTITSVTINTRAKRRAGQTVYTYYTGTYAINISSFILEDRVPDQAVKNVIAHEILHTCKGCMNHGDPWKAEADKFMARYPEYTIARTSSMECFGFDDSEVSKMYKYLYKCDKCGRMVGRHRESHFTRCIECYRCGKCGGTFTAIRLPENKEREVLRAAMRFPS